jgi:hypothetical protein
MARMTFAQNIGDYRNTLAIGPAYINSTIGWQEYTGPGIFQGWKPASRSLSERSPFNGNVHVNKDLVINTDFQLNGNFTGGDNTKITVSGIGTTFTLGEGGNCTLHSMDVNARNEFINKGTTTFTSGNSELRLMYFGTLDDQDGGKLDNYGTINLDGKLIARNESLIISQANAKIVGMGMIDAPGLRDVQFRIANAGGWDDAFRLSGEHNVRNCCFVFDGSTDQVAGNIPTPIFSLTVDSGHKLTVTKQIDLYGYASLTQGYPHVRVKSGSTMDLVKHMITTDCEDFFGAATFTLEDGATLMTAYPTGISSYANAEDCRYKIGYGAIRTNSAYYSSGANYVYNGTDARQFSGCFITEPESNTVHDLTNLNPHGLDLCKNFRPLEVTGTVTGEVNTDPDVKDYGYVRAPTLPVTLSYFNAFFNGFDSVMLQWETQSETNNLGFYLLRSVEPDATRANVISGLVPATNSPQGAVYCFEDSSLYEDGVYYYWLQDVSFDGQIELHGPVLAQVTLRGGTSQTPDLPLKTGLICNYPNPFNPSTQLEYYLEKEADVDFKVYNLKGQLVDQITLRHQDSGFHRYTWTPRLSSGFYLIRFTAEGKSNTRKVILSK